MGREVLHGRRLHTVPTPHPLIVRTGIAGLRIEMKGELEGLRGDVRSLDRDISALMEHTFGIDRG